MTGAGGGVGVVRKAALAAAGALCVIPARLGSTRLPRKPLAIVKGKPLIQHTYERAIQATKTVRTVVGTV